MILAGLAHDVTVATLEDLDWRTHVVHANRTLKVFVENTEV
jgi:hypothetical protein